MQVLFAGAELYPYVKVGGLGDVMAALPRALRKAGADVRVIVPGFPAVLSRVSVEREVMRIPDLFGGGEARILFGETPDGLPLYAVDCPGFYERHGDPYAEWGDSARRFAAFSYAIARLGLDGDGLGFRPSVVHCHDWQTALAPVYIGHDWSGRRVPTVLTIHNLAYQGVYPSAMVEELRLSRECFHLYAAEYHGQLNFLKAGLGYAWKITTVSPTYAREITSPDGGFGLDGLLAHRSYDLVGIVNGIDDELWDPAESPELPVNFDVKTLDRRLEGKIELQRRLGLDVDPNAPLFGVVSRLAEIKGLDLVLSNVDWIRHLGGQLVVLGRGDHDLEARFRAAELANRGRVCSWIGYDEGLAHHVFAAVDSLIVPSRSEPCGLTQMYAQRYGALPLVRATGGLADTVTEISPESLEDGTGTGFRFDRIDGWALGDAIGRANALFHDAKGAWRKAQVNGMTKDWSWGPSARRYLEVYRSIAQW
ncbi:MAG: glycogen synthase GlgA [Polyangiales bacterium]